MRLRHLTLVLAALALAAAGCGDDDDDGGNGGGGGGGSSSESQGAGAYGGGGGDEKAAGGGGGGSTLDLAADPGGALKFDKTSLDAKAGKVTIAFENTSGVPHAVEVEGSGVEEETDVITDGSAKLPLDLGAGEYEFYCPVGNHREAGMEGTLTVK